MSEEGFERNALAASFALDDASEAAPTRPAKAAAPPAVEEALVEGIVPVGAVVIVEGVVMEFNAEEVALETAGVLDA